MSEPKIRVADYILDELARAGVETVFTVTGGGAIFLCDALGRHASLKYVCCHHEQAVAISAEAYARAKGPKHLGAALVTSGPGGTNAITGAAGAWMDSVPMIVLSGQVYSTQTIGQTGVRQLGVQEINIIDLVKPITKYAQMVVDPLSIRYHLEKSLYLARSGRPGPVWLDIPADIQNAKVIPSELRAFDPASELDDFSSVVPAELLAQLVDYIKTSKRPLVHVGQGVKIAGAVQELFEFLEEQGIPFVTARNANDITSWDHPLYVGRPGTFAQRGANFAIQNADFYLAIGTRLSLPQTGYDSKDFARSAKKVMVDIDASELHKPTLKIDLKIQADALQFIRSLRSSLGSYRGTFQKWRDQCVELKEKYPVCLPEYAEQKTFVNSYYFTEELSQMLTDQDVIVTDMGLSFQGTHQGFKVKKGQIFFTNSGFAAMGWGLPAAVGACVGSHQRRTICITGEGGLMMNLQELATIQHLKLPIVVFIYNNGGYLTIKQTQEIGFESRLMGVNQETGLSFPDFSKIADAHGFRFKRIANHSALSAGLHEILNSSGLPWVCELMLDPNQLQSPRYMVKKKADGSTEIPKFEDLHPFLSPDEIRANLMTEKEKNNHV